MSFHQCTELFVQLNVLCLGNWLHAPLRKKCGEVLIFSIFHPTRLFRPTQLLIWMNFPPYTIIPHCTAIRHFTVLINYTFFIVLWICSRITVSWLNIIFIILLVHISQALHVCITPFCTALRACLRYLQPAVM